MPTFVNYHVYVLPILRYSGFPWVVPTNTGIFKTMQRKQTLASAFGIQNENWGYAFFRDNKASIWKKNAMLLHCFLEQLLFNYL